MKLFRDSKEKKTKNLGFYKTSEKIFLTSGAIILIAISTLGLVTLNQNNDEDIKLDNVMVVEDLANGPQLFYYQRSDNKFISVDEEKSKNKYNIHVGKDYQGWSSSSDYVNPSNIYTEECMPLAFYLENLNGVEIKKSYTYEELLKIEEKLKEVENNKGVAYQNQ